MSGREGDLPLVDKEDRSPEVSVSDVEGSDDPEHANYYTTPEEKFQEEVLIARKEAKRTTELEFAEKMNQSDWTTASSAASDKI